MQDSASQPLSPTSINASKGFSWDQMLATQKEALVAEKLGNLETSVYATKNAVRELRSPEAGTLMRFNPSAGDQNESQATSSTQQSTTQEMNKQIASGSFNQAPRASLELRHSAAGPSSKPLSASTGSRYGPEAAESRTYQAADRGAPQEASPYPTEKNEQPGTTRAVGDGLVYIRAARDTTSIPNPPASDAMDISQVLLQDTNSPQKATKDATGSSTVPVKNIIKIPATPAAKLTANAGCSTSRPTQTQSTTKGKGKAKEPVTFSKNRRQKSAAPSTPNDQTQTPFRTARRIHSFLSDSSSDLTDLSDESDKEYGSDVSPEVMPPSPQRTQASQQLDSYHCPSPIARINGKKQKTAPVEPAPPRPRKKAKADTTVDRVGGESASTSTLQKLSTATEIDAPNAPASNSQVKATYSSRKKRASMAGGADTPATPPQFRGAIKPSAASTPKDSALSTQTVRRVKLVVRPQPPSFSNPGKIPLPPKYENSIAAYLQSYTNPVGKITTAKGAQQYTLRRVQLWERIDKAKREGLLSQNVASVVAGLSSNGPIPVLSELREEESRLENMVEWEISRDADIWDKIVRQVESCTSRSGDQHLLSARAREAQNISRTIADAVKKYYKDEENKVIALASKALKPVTEQWKKIVVHVRKQKEIQDAQESLGNLLEESGQLLSTQQRDLGQRRRKQVRIAGVNDSEEDNAEDSDREPYDSEVNLPPEDDDMDDKDPVEDSHSSLEQDSDSDEDEYSKMRALLKAHGPPPTSPLLSPDNKLPSLSPAPHRASLSQTPTPAPTPPVPDTGIDVAAYDAEWEHGSSHTPFVDFEELFQSQQDRNSTVVDFPLDDPNTFPAASGDMDVDGDQLDIEMSEPPSGIPPYLRPFMVAPVDWNPLAPMKPLLLRADLRPYQQSGLEWLASLHTNMTNGILADEMGLGKTVQTIALLAHLACERGIWGPHLIVVPTSVLLNWEMEFKKFLPGFKVITYHGSKQRRKELRQGWSDKYHFNVCITSYSLALKDERVLKRKPWYYLVLDEAHLIKNFRSQRWNSLMVFKSFRRLLLTGTPLQNNLTELWALMQCLKAGSEFANVREFGQLFSNPVEKAIEMGGDLREDVQDRVTQLHTVLRPYLLRRLKRDVEKQLPSKVEHLTLCPLSKRQRFLYDEFMARAQTQDALISGEYQKIANILMQLRKVCNHPDLFEVRPVKTSFVMTRSAVADFEIKELLLRRRFLEDESPSVDLGFLGLQFTQFEATPIISAISTRRLDASRQLWQMSQPDLPEEPPPEPEGDERNPAKFAKVVYSRSKDYHEQFETTAYWRHQCYVNHMKCQARSQPRLGSILITSLQGFTKTLSPLSAMNCRRAYLATPETASSMVTSYEEREEQMSSYIDRFAFVTPSVIAHGIAGLALAGYEDRITELGLQRSKIFGAVLHRATVKRQIAFPDASLLQYDCGKLQKLAELLRERYSGRHRVLIFTQMTRVLDILEQFMSLHGWLYLRLDGSTKIEDRQYITEKFNADERVFCFISSSRSGGIGINLTGADTVIFYDSDFNPQMDRQCEDRAHRIGQTRDVHIYRFVSQHTVEEAMLLRADQKRYLDNLVIHQGAFDWSQLFNDSAKSSRTQRALGMFDEEEDRLAALAASREERAMYGDDEQDFGPDDGQDDVEEAAQGEGDDGEESGTIEDYMISFVKWDQEFFDERFT